MNTQPVTWQPEKYGTVDPYLVVRGVEKFITFLESAFDAQVELKVPNPDGSIGHAEVRIGDSVLLMFDANEAWLDTPAFLRIFQVILERRVCKNFRKLRHTKAAVLPGFKNTKKTQKPMTQTLLL